MASNTSLINDLVLPDSLVTFRNNSVLTNMLKPHYDDSYEFKGAKAGQAINLRTHQEFSVREDTLNFSGQGIEQKEVPLVRSKIFGIDFAYTDAELTQDVEGFMQYRVEPAMATLAAKVDAYVMGVCSDGVNQGVLAVTNIDGDDILESGVQLDNASVPRGSGRNVILSPRGHKQLVSSSNGLFNNATNISQQYSDGIVSLPSYGFNFGMTQNVNTHARGSANTAYDVKTIPSSGATVLDIDTGAGTIKKGDIFTIVGVNQVNKLTKTDTGELMQFVCTADNDTGGDTTINISPAIISTGPYQNVTALPAVDADLVFLGTASTNYPQGLAFHSDFAAVGFCDLVMPKAGIIDGARKVEDGVSMRCITFFDGNTSEQKIRFDILCGAVVVEPTMASRIYTP